MRVTDAIITANFQLLDIHSLLERYTFCTGKYLQGGGLCTVPQE